MNKGYSRKTIERVLSKKIEDFASSIEDERVRDLVLKNTIVTGGSIASMLLGEEINDFDLYFKDKQTTIEVAKYYVEEFRQKHDAPFDSVLVLHKDHKLVQEILKNQAHLQNLDLTKDEWEENINELALDEVNRFNIAQKYELSFRIIHSIFETFKNDLDRVKIFFTGSWGAKGEVDTSFEDEVDTILEEEVETKEEETKYGVSFISANAITLKNKIQLIIRFYGDAQTIHENFDFVHAMNYWTSSDRKLYTKVEALESLMARRLVYNGSKYPLASIFRSKKFILRGFNINAGQYLKMVFQLNEMDLTNSYVLEEQLTGVDLLYFSQIISDLKEKQLKDEDFKPSTKWFIDIVSKMFD